MDKILKRDDYIKEIYTPMMEEKEYEELKVINEGLLKNIFGSIKNLFKQDWSTITGDQSIIDRYKELDQELSGFTMMKLLKRDRCNQVRQQLVNFAEDWFDILASEADKGNGTIAPIESMEFEDKTLRKDLEACEKQIKTICDGDPQMIKWSQLLLNNMKHVINRAIINKDYADDASKKQIEDMEKEGKDAMNKENKEMEKVQKDSLTEIEKERVDLISKAGATPVDEKLEGNKAVQNLCSEYNNIKDGVEKAKKNKQSTKQPFKNSQILGFKNLLSDDDLKNNNAFKTTSALWDAFYAQLNTNENMKLFEQTPSRSIQAMCISVNIFIKSCVYGDQSYTNSLPLMAKCAIVSEGISSYNIPLSKTKVNGKQLNYFSDTLGKLTAGKFENPTTKEKLAISDDFKKNAKTLMNKIIKEAEKMMKETEDKYNSNSEKLLKQEKDNDVDLNK